MLADLETYTRSNIDDLIWQFEDENTDHLFTDEINNAFYDYIEKSKIVRKDVNKGDLLKVETIYLTNNSNLNIICQNGLSLVCPLKKEKKFFDVNGIKFNDIEELKQWINENGSEWINENNFFVKTDVNNSVISGSLMSAHYESIYYEMLEQIKKSDKVYTAKIIERNRGGYLVNVSGFNAFLPGGLAATNKIIDFDSYIDKILPVMVEDYLRESNMFVVSYKKYVERILPEKIKELDLDSCYKGIVTGSSRFGIFIEFDEILTGLLHSSEMDSETLDGFNEQKYQPGDELEFWIKKIDNPKRIILTQNQNAVENKMTYEDFQIKFESKWLEGEINNNTYFGTFVKFVIDDSSFIGLLHKSSYTEGFDPENNKNIKVFIDRVDPEAKKIYLKLKND